jgi:hypothetical protein
MGKEQTFSLCLHLNIKGHRKYKHKPVECVLCGAHVRGLIYHIKTIDHTFMFAPHIITFIRCSGSVEMPEI